MSTGQVTPQPTADVGEGLFPGGWIIEGFQTARLNQVYSVDKEQRIAGRPTYWDNDGLLFMYYQDDEQRWAVCPLVDEGENLWRAVQAGSNRGLAFEDGAGQWSEFLESEGRWVTRRVRLTRLPEASRSTGTARVPQLPPAAPAASSKVAAAKPLEAADGVRVSIQEASRAQRLPGDAGAQEVRAWTARGPSSRKPGASGRAGAGDRREGDRVVPNARRFLEENPHVEEVLILKGRRRAKIVLRFKGAQAASTAAEAGSRLLRGCRVKALKPVSPSKFNELRQDCERWKRARREGGPAPSAPSVGAAAAAAG